MKCCGRLDSRGQWHLGATNPLSSGGPTNAITDIKISGSVLTATHADGMETELNLPAVAVPATQTVRFVNASGTEEVATVITPPPTGGGGHNLS